MREIFYNEKNASFRLIGVYHAVRGKGKAETAGRGFATLSYRIKGNARFFCGGKTWDAGSGSTVFLPDRTDFIRENGSEEEILALHLKCEGDFPREIGVENETEELEALFRRMLEIWQEGSPTAYNRCMSLLYTIFETLQKLKQKDLAELPGTIAPGVKMIRERFRDPAFTVAEAARASFVSEVYFRRVYREFFGTSPLKGLLKMRFETAYGLLRSGYYSVEETARLSGFADPKYFRTAFSKYYGKTPAAVLREKR